MPRLQWFREVMAGIGSVHPLAPLAVVYSKPPPPPPQHVLLYAVLHINRVIAKFAADLMDYAIR